ncbi:MAG: hypothetical protein QNM02_03355, partial [Acidimicrobiia bacterium]|nr:hypothetical protein [Acidimicrobiia bacterium]
MSAPDGQGSDFGANSWLVEEMYERFVADPSAVSESWQEFFADYHSQAPSVAAAAAASPAVRSIAEDHGAPAAAAGPPAAAAPPPAPAAAPPDGSAPVAPASSAAGA